PADFSSTSTSSMPCCLRRMAVQIPPGPAPMIRTESTAFADLSIEFTSELGGSAGSCFQFECLGEFDEHVERPWIGEREVDLIGPSADIAVDPVDDLVDRSDERRLALPLGQRRRIGFRHKHQIDRAAYTCRIAADVFAVSMQDTALVG